MKQNYFFKPQKVTIALLLTLFIGYSTLFSQTNVDVSSAITINSFPHTEPNVNSISVGSGNATGMNGSCSTIPCCGVLYYRIELPSDGDLTVVNNNFLPLSSSIIAYESDVSNPTNNSNLTYLSQAGNFCGFRDTLTLTGLTSSNVYYLLIFTSNQQANIHSGDSDFDFTFTPNALTVEDYEDLKRTIILSPNPSNDFIKVLGLTKTEKYRIFNVFGSEISEGNISNNEKIDIKNLINGMYFLKIESGNTLKFMKK